MRETGWDVVSAMNAGGRPGDVPEFRPEPNWRSLYEELNKIYKESVRERVVLQAYIDELEAELKEQDTHG